MILLLIERRLVHQLESGISNLVGVKVPVTSCNVPGQTGVHVLNDHEVVDVGRWVTDYRDLGRQSPGGGLLGH